MCDKIESWNLNFKDSSASLGSFNWNSIHSDAFPVASSLASGTLLSRCSNVLKKKRDREREKKREKGTIPLSKSFAFFIAFSHFFVTRLISFEYIYAERGESLEYHIKQPSYSNRSSHYPLLQVMFNTFNFDIFIRSIFETCSY